MRIFLGPTGFLPVGPLCFWGSEEREADRPDDSAQRARTGGQSYQVRESRAQSKGHSAERKRGRKS